MKNLTNSFIVILALIILAVPLRSQDCISQSQVTIVDNDTTILSLIVENALNETLGENGQGLCKVKISFTHEYIGDLLVELIAPNGQSIILMGPPTTNSSSTDLVCWDVCFVPNSFVAIPDADFDDYWNNLNNWAILSKYTGSYYPFNGIFEDFDGGSVNGTWTLRVNDISEIGEGVIENFELIFCDPSGLDCFNCNPNGGTIAPLNLAYCEGDNNLIIPFEPDFGNDIPDPDVYDYLNVVSDNNDTVVEYTELIDMTSYDPGIYEVCGISILSDAVQDLPIIDGSFNLDSIKNQIALGLICAESTIGCYNVEVYNIPDTVFVFDTICLGASSQIGTQSFDTENVYEVTLFNGECDSIVVLDLEVVDIDANAIADNNSISCSDEFLILDGSGSVLDDHTVVEWTTADGGIISDPTQLVIQVNASGTYVLTLMDNQCVETASITITSDEDLPEVNFDNISALDCETDSVQININVPGTITDYIWDGPGGFNSILEDPFVYLPGTYYVIVMNDFGCEGLDSIEVIFDNLLDIPIFTHGVLTCDSLQTQIVTEIANDQNYTFNWNGLSGTYTSMEQSPVVTEPGMYTLSVEGLNGCEENYEVEIIENISFPDLMITVDTVLCTNPFATIEIEVESTTTILWDDTSLGNDLIVFVEDEGQYNFTITSENGCELDSFAMVTVDTLIPILTLTDSLIINCVDSIQLINSYQNVNLLTTYYWTGPFEFTSDVQEPYVYDQGMYTVVVTNDNGCIRQGTIEVILGEDEPDFVFASDTIDCIIGMVDINVSPDPAGFSFNWDGPDEFMASIPSPTVNVGGGYKVTVTDDNTGCTARYEVGVITELVPKDIEIQGGVLGCLMEPVELSYTIEDFDVMTAMWTGPNFQFTGDIASVSEEGMYHLSLLGDNGCEYNDSIEIILNLDPPALVAQDTFIGCGQIGINLVVSSNIEVDSYEWEGPGLLSNDESPFVTDFGQYTVTVTGINGCENIANIIVSEETEIPDIEVSGGLEINCTTTNTEIIILTTGTIESYEWNGPQVIGNVSSAIITDPGDYSVTVTSSSFCTNEINFTIEQVDVLPEVESEVVDISCATDEKGTISLTTLDDIVSYVWIGPGDFMDEGAEVIVTEPGDYTVVFTDSNGCMAEETFTVNMFISIPEVVNVVEGVLDCNSVNTLIGVETVTQMEFYNWSGPNGFMFSGNYPLVDMDGVYTVELVDSFGCSLVQDIEVVLDTISPILEAFGSAINCLENKVELSFLSNESDITFVWSGPDNFSSEELKPIVNLPGDYMITVVGPNGCAAFEIYEVIEDFSGPVIEAFDTSLPCNTDPAILQVSSSTENVDFIWFGPGNFISEMQNPTTTDVGEYIVVATGPNGCISRDTIIVDDIPILPIFDFSTGVISCASPEVTLSALFVDDDTSVEWIGPNMFSSDQAEVIVAVGGDYQLVVMGTNGCTDTAHMEVLVDTIAPYTEAVSEDFLKCTITQIVLDGSGSDIGPFYNPSWFSNQGDILEGENSYTPVIGKPGMYYLQVQDTRNGCIGMDSVLVEEVPNSLSAIEVDLVAPLCFGYTNGSAHVLQTLGGSSPYTYSLNESFYSSIQDFYLLSSGEHVISVKDSAGCTLDTTILIRYGRELDVSLGPDTLIRLGESILLPAVINIDPSEIASVRWLPTPDVVCNNCLEINVSPSETTQYEIKVTDEHGCFAEDFVIVRVKDESPLYIPNIFSPNNDDSNDEFMIFGGTGVEQIDYINILDRWGNIVFEAFDFQPEDPTISWNGIYRKKPLQPAVFSYIIGYTMLNGVARQEAGTITLIR